MIQALNGLVSGVLPSKNTLSHTTLAVQNTVQFGHGTAEATSTADSVEIKHRTKKRTKTSPGVTITKKENGSRVARFRVYNPDPENIVSARLVFVKPLTKEQRRDFRIGERVKKRLNVNRAIIEASSKPQKDLGGLPPCPNYQERLDNAQHTINAKKDENTRLAQRAIGPIVKNPFKRLGYRGWSPREIEKAGVVDSKQEMKPVTSKAGYAGFSFNQPLGKKGYPGQYFIEYTDKNGNRTLSTDNYSTAQPLGADGPSAVAKKGYKWQSKPLGSFDFRQANIYGLHVGTFTPNGDLKSIYSKKGHPLEGKYETMLDFIKAMGFNTIQLNPIQQFSGNQGWGYGTTHFSAIHNKYGTTRQFKKLVDECHKRGIRVIMDVVYNHPGPEFSPLPNYARHKNGTPFGDAINIAEPRTKQMVLRNLLYFAKQCKVDGFRFDQVNILDNTHDKQAALQHIMEKLHQKRPGLMLIAEHENTNSKPVHPPAWGGEGFTHQYAYKLEKALEAMMTGERQESYWPHPSDFAKAAVNGGTERVDDLNSLMTFSTTHDVVGNNGGSILRSRRDLNPEQNASLRRMLYTLARLLPGPTYHFNGEMGADEHFNYFVDFKTRSALNGNVYGRIQDGQKGFSTDKQRFLDSKRRWNFDPNTTSLVAAVNHIRANTPALWQSGRHNNKGENAFWVDDQYRDNGVFSLYRKGYEENEKPADEIFAVANYSGSNWDNNFEINFPPGKWERVLDTNENRYGGQTQASQTPIIDAGEQASRKGVSISPYGLTLYRKITGDTQIGSTEQYKRQADEIARQLAS